MKLLIILLLFLHDMNCYGAEVYYKFEEKSKGDSGAKFFRSVNNYFYSEPNASSYSSSSAMQLKSRQIYVKRKDRNACIDDKFREMYFEDGDEIAINENEIDSFAINIVSKIDCKYDNKSGFLKKLFSKKYSSFYRDILAPCVIFRGKLKFTGLCIYNDLLQMKQIYRDKISLKDIVLYKTNPNLTILYAFLPSGRDRAGKLFIKHNGKIVKKSFDIFGRSKSQWESDGNLRLTQKSSTPQGIYTVFGIMNNPFVKALGLTEYLNIDYGFAPINSLPDTSFFMTQILPHEALNTYWANEWILANAFERRDIRIHGNDKNEDSVLNIGKNGQKFTHTAGCINIGEKSQQLVDLMGKLGLIHRKKEYDASSRYIIDFHDIGKVFLIVKDYEVETELQQLIRDIS